MNKNILEITQIRILIYLFATAAILSSCTKNTSINPKVTSISPGTGAGNQVLTVQGSGLFNIQSVVFDLGNVPAALNPNFNTDKAVIFRVPTAANVGLQHIVFTFSSGYQYSIPFTVVAVPSIVSAFPAEWEAGSTITITGNYLSTANHVTIVGSSDTATILSASATQLVLQMPSSSVPSAKITIFNDAGSSTSTFSLTNMDQQLKFFTDSFGPGMQDWSWCNSSISTDFAISGTKSLKEVFSAGGYQGMSFHWDDTIVSAQYQALSFWVKGGSNDNTIKIFPDAVITGSAGNTTVAVPSSVWTFMSIPMSTFGTVTCQRFDFQITGPSGADQTLYFDNVILVKQ